MGFNYNITGSASTAIASQAAMDGGDGGWAVLYGNNPVTNNSLTFAIDEDQVADAERSHTTEQVGYIVFGDPSQLVPRLSITESSATKPEGDTGGTAFTFTVTRSGWPLPPSSCKCG